MGHQVACPVFPTSVLFVVQFSLENKVTESGFIPLLSTQSSRTSMYFEWFSNLRGHQNPWNRLGASPPRVSGPGWGQVICTSIISDDANAADLGTF